MCWGTGSVQKCGAAISCCFVTSCSTASATRRDSCHRFTFNSSWVKSPLESSRSFFSSAPVWTQMFDQVNQKKNTSLPKAGSGNTYMQASNDQQHYLPTFFLLLPNSSWHCWHIFSTLARDAAVHGQCTCHTTTCTIAKPSGERAANHTCHIQVSWEVPGSKAS